MLYNIKTKLSFRSSVTKFNRFWRADRPQKDVLESFINVMPMWWVRIRFGKEVELVQLYDSVFSQLGLGGVTIKINNRKILSGIAEVIGASDKID